MTDRALEQITADCVERMGPRLAARIIAAGRAGLGGALLVASHAAAGRLIPALGRWGVFALAAGSAIAGGWITRRL